MRDKTKKCPQCKKNKELSCFGLDANRNKYDGLATYCKYCRNLNRREFYKKNTEKERKKAKNY
jgi:hypothetical protein